MKFPPDFVDKLWSGKPLPRNERGKPVYRDGQGELSFTLWFRAKWQPAEAEAAMEKLDRVPGYVLLSVSERVCELIQEAEPRPSFELHSGGRDPLFREIQKREDEARRKLITFEVVAQMCIAGILAVNAVNNVRKTMAQQRPNPARVIKRAVI
jgi:hypothetical protein